MLSTIRIFEKDMQQSECTAKILSSGIETIRYVKNKTPQMVETIFIICDQTIFHPQSGGQPADKGTINGKNVLTVREDKNLPKTEHGYIIKHYFLATEIHLEDVQVETEVSMIIDNTFRSECSQYHSAGHLIADIAECSPQFQINEFTSLKGHHFPGEAYVELGIKIPLGSLDTFKNDFNHAFKQIINEAKPLATCMIDNKRHIKIAYQNRMCGGTHVNSTSELSGFMINKIKQDRKDTGEMFIKLWYGNNN